MAEKTAAPAQTFDPFHSRLCRDARNELSISFMPALRSKDLSAVLDIVREYSSGDVDFFVKNYMEDRLKRYQRVVYEIRSQNIAQQDTYRIACHLWNQALFFEFHEWLEAFWHRAAGSEKQVLQALIRSAGVYLLLEAGRINGAKKMAAKAAAGLRKLRPLVPGFFDAGRLIDKLTAFDPVPPEFGCR
jgi:hypothetical protein